MRFLNRLLGRRAKERELADLYRAAEEGGPTPDTNSQTRAAFEADSRLIQQMVGLRATPDPERVSAAREVLLSSIAERTRERAEKPVTVFARIPQKRTLAIATAAFLLAVVAASAGASGTVNHVSGGVKDVAQTLQIRDSGSNPVGGVAGEPTEEQEVEGAGEGAIELCHFPPGNPDNAHTILIGETDLDEHLAHGDTEGGCAEGSLPGPTETQSPDVTPDDIEVQGIGPQGSVEVCHAPPGNPDNAHTISIGEPALERHLEHGDTEGPCTDDPTPSVTPTPTPTEEPDGSVTSTIEVCHVPAGNPAHARTMEIPEQALESHLAHGDTEGACPGGEPFSGQTQPETDGPEHPVGPPDDIPRGSGQSE